METLTVVKPRRCHDSGTSHAIGVIAGVVVVTIAVTLLAVLDLPQRLGCETRRAVTTVTTVTTDPDCPLDGTPASTRADRPEASPAHESNADTGLRGRLLSDDSVSAPPLAPEVLAPQGYDRCALAPDQALSWICLSGSNTTTVFTGSDTVLRCTGSSSTSTTTCGESRLDSFASLRSGPADGDVRFCQPVGVPEARGGTHRVSWACQSWSGHLYRCTSEVPVDVLGTRRQDTLIGWSEPADWTSSPRFRDLWPRVCDSRTFELGELGCTPDGATNLASCSVRGFQSLPVHDMRCAWFEPAQGEDVATSHTLRRPMHCTATLSGDAPPLSALAGSVAPGSVTAGSTLANDPCPVSATGRRLQAGRMQPLLEARCAAPVDISGHYAYPPIYDLTSSRLRIAVMHDLLDQPNVSVEVIEGLRFKPVHRIVENAASLVKAMYRAGVGPPPTLPSILAMSNPTGILAFGQHQNFVGVGRKAKFTDAAAYRNLARWVTMRLGIPMGTTSSEQALFLGLEQSLQLAMADDDHYLGNNEVEIPLSTNSPEVNAEFIVWVYSRLRWMTQHSEWAAATLVLAVQNSGGTFAGFAAALPQALAQVYVELGFPGRHPVNGLALLLGSRAWQAIANQTPVAAPTTIVVIQPDPDDNPAVCAVCQLPVP